MPCPPTLPALLATSALTKMSRGMFDDTFAGIHQLGWFDWALLVPYFGILAILSVYGIHRCDTILTYFRHRKKAIGAPVHFDKLPPVTIQLPLFNERYVLERLIDEVVKIPVGHMDGNYFCDAATLNTLQREQRIVFRYSTPQGEITAAANPNGSLDNIAGICNQGRNVLGMMPHPDRSSEAMLGSADGFKVFQSMVAALVAK